MTKYNHLMQGIYKTLKRMDTRKKNDFFLNNNKMQIDVSCITQDYAHMGGG